MSPRAEGEPSDREPISWWGARRRRGKDAQLGGSPDACPDCRSSAKVVPIYYGEPTPDVSAKARKGRLVLGGNRDPKGRPRRHCKQCGRDF